MELNGQLLVIVLIVAAIIVLILLVCCRPAHGHHHHKDHHDGKGHHAKCIEGAPRPSAPSGLVLTSEDTFSVQASWTAPANCDVDHYCVYVKYLDSCPTPVEGSRKKVSHGVSYTPGHAHGCACHICMGTPVQYVTPASPDVHCGAGPTDYTRVEIVSGADRMVIISNITAPAVTISVTAVDGCGQESKTCACATICVNTECRLYPCIVQDDCRGVNLKWHRSGCADLIRIYYDGELQFEVPGDAGGVNNLPPMGEEQEAATTITVRTVNSGGESQDWPVTTECPTYSSPCSYCSQPSCNGSCHHGH